MNHSLALADRELSCNDLLAPSEHGVAGSGSETPAAEIERWKRDEQRMEFLARAGEVLASSLDLDTTLEHAARLCVPFMADYCFIDLVEGGSFRRVALAFAEEEDGAPLPEAELERRRGLVASCRRLFPLGHGAAAGVARVIQSGQPELHAQVGETHLRSTGYDGDHVKMLRDLRVSSAMCVPLQTRGRTLGAVSLVRSRTLASLEASQAAGEESAPGMPPPYVPGDLKLAQDLARITALAVDNARLYGEAEAASKAKDDFLAVLSHELRTPLTPILGWVHLLRERKPDDELYFRALDIIETNARAQSRLIEDLIDVSRVVTGKLSLEKRTLSLDRLVADVVEAARPQALAAGLSLELEAIGAVEFGAGTAASDEAALPVLGDEGRLRQALNNLLSNALKFTPPGGRVRVSLERMLGPAGGSAAEGAREGAREGNSTWARVVVSDSGRGIAPEFLPRLFERFEQADSSNVRGQGGLGLGLAIVRHITLLHGGEVSAHSDGLDRGATFSLELPLALPAPVAASSSGQSRPALLSIEGARVLVVDDEPDAREILETMLSRAGATVLTAPDAEQAWQAFEQWQPDILVSDVSLPGEDGCALMRRVRALPAAEGGAVPALAVTAHARVQDRERVLESGFHLHVAKPIDPAKLALAVLELLSLARTQS
jgi:signal transduction histidine kinase/CheY-like chemotaxis protein